MLNDRVVKAAFLISFVGHCLFLGMPVANLNLPIFKQDEKLAVWIEIEKPHLLPKIDVLGDKKKLKTEERKQKIEAREKQEHLPEEIVVEEPIREAKLQKEKIEVLNPAQEAMLRYEDMVKQRIEEVRRYPNWAKQQGIEGTVCLDFVVLANGLSKDIKITSSSSSNVLDEEAIATIQRADPFPPIPHEINQDFVAMEIIIVFTLN